MPKKLPYVGLLPKSKVIMAELSVKQMYLQCKEGLLLIPRPERNVKPRLTPVIINK